MIKIKKLSLTLFVFSISFTAFTWTNKEEYEQAFSQSVDSFLKSKKQSVIFNRNIASFVGENTELLKDYNKFCVYDPNNPNSPWTGVMRNLDAFTNTGLDGFDTFFCVGPNKALAYLPTHTYIINEELKSMIESYAEKIGFETYINAVPGERGALWLFDPVTLQNLLEQNKKLLQEHSLTTDPLDFIKKINQEDENGNQPFNLISGKAGMYQLIARVFGREISLEEIENLMKKILS